MAHTACWYNTSLPSDIIDILTKDIEIFDSNMKSSKVGYYLSEDRIEEGELNTKSRISKHAWIPSSHWIGGFLWYYIQRINDENFKYDINKFSGNDIQYTKYTQGSFFTWHTDQDITSFDKSTESIRKLSFTLQLSDPMDYTGGDVQFYSINGDNSKSFFAPRERGSMIVFDSRTPHRVRKIKSGIRKSLVGWIEGPRWK